MAQGNPDNVNIWAEADVHIGTLAAVTPGVGEEPGVDWDFVGILDGAAGFGGARESDQTDHFGWGWGIIAQTDKNYKETKTFTALEANEVILRLMHPGTDFTFDEAAGDTAKIKVPSREKFKIMFTTRNGTVTERNTSVAYAMLEGWPVPSVNDESPGAVEVTSVIYPNADQELWDWQRWDSSTLVP